MKVRMTIAGIGAAMLLSCGSESAADPSLIHGRLWVEKLPTSRTEHVHALVVANRPKRGVFSNSTIYDLRVEMFEYAREEGKVKLKFPQSDKKAELSYKITECDSPPFDLCLDLDKNPWGGPKRYYARTARLRGDDLAELETTLRALAGDE